MTKSALIALYLTLFSVSIWIIFDLYQSNSKVQIPETITKIAEPISDTIDLEMLKLLAKRSKQ